METRFLERTKELKKELKFLESKLNVKIKIDGKKVVVEGDSLNEYETCLVLEALNFGFSAQDSILLKDEDILFRILNIKDFTRRKNLHEVRARIIGTHGQTKKTLEEISKSKIIIKENKVGILGNAEEIEYAITAISNIIKGSKQSNVYKYLEKTKPIN